MSGTRKRMKGYGFFIKMLENGDMLVRYNSPDTWFQTVLKTDDEKDEIITLLTDRELDRYYDEYKAVLIPYGSRKAEKILFLKDTGFI